MPVYIPWVEALPLTHRVDTTHAMERRGFSAWLKKLAPNASVLSPPGTANGPLAGRAPSSTVYATRTPTSQRF